MKVSQSLASLAFRSVLGLFVCLLTLGTALVVVAADAADADETATTSEQTATPEQTATSEHTASSPTGSTTLARKKPSSGNKELPSIAEVKEIVAGQFSKAELKGDTVISRNQVKPLFAKLLKAGWRVEDAEAIYEQVPGDDDFIVKQLRTSKGIGFGKDVAAFPGAWDTIDRLSKLPHGRSTIRQLVKGPDGYKMIEYITTTRGGANMATMLSNGPKGKDFKKPTGKIYTVPMLMDRLEQSYVKARSAESQTAQR